MNPNKALWEKGAGVPVDSITLAKDSYTFGSSAAPQQVIESFRHYYGPTMNAYEAAETSGRVDELHQQLVALAEAQNQATDGSTRISATFMRVTVRR